MKRKTERVARIAAKGETVRVLAGKELEMVVGGVIESSSGTTSVVSKQLDSRS